MILSAKDICKSYKSGNDSLSVLKNLNLKINESEFISIMGPSGAGKSTLLHILGTIDEFDSGNLNINFIEIIKGKDYSNFRSKNIGFVFQFHHLLPDFSAFENVLIPTWIRDKEDMESYAIELFERLDLANRKNHMPSELSGGERSRVALIRAIINKPALLLADEPTGNLDEKNSVKLIDLLCDINRDFNQTIILTTHNPDVAAIGNKRFVLESGILK